jgi:hypothetical protein
MYFYPVSYKVKCFNNSQMFFLKLIYVFIFVVLRMKTPGPFTSRTASTTRVTTLPFCLQWQGLPATFPQGGLELTILLPLPLWKLGLQSVPSHLALFPFKYQLIILQWYFKFFTVNCSLTWVVVKCGTHLNHKYTLALLNEGFMRAQYIWKVLYLWITNSSQNILQWLSKMLYALLFSHEL